MKIKIKKIFNSFFAIIIFFATMSCAKIQTEPIGDIKVDNISITPCPYILFDTILLKSSVINRMPNGGGKNTTDWIGSPVAYGWHGVNGIPNVFQILTNGTDRMQKVSSVNQFVMYSPEPTQIPEVYHTLSFRYLTNTNFFVVVRYTDHCGYRIFDGISSSGWQNIQITFWSPRILSIMFYNHPNQPGWLVLDNVNLF